MQSEYKKEHLWQGRFSEQPSSAAIDFETSIFQDVQFVNDDIDGSIAHVSMLAKQGLILQDEANAIITELQTIKTEIKSGALKIDYSAEDIHSFIEQVLSQRLGDIGKKVHTGRSRNDQIALDERLFLRHKIPQVQSYIVKLIDVLINIAEHHTETLMSGYTHLQRAQPVSLGHHLCAWATMLVRDFERLSDALKRIDLSPLGAGALATTGLPLHREYVAELLGFSGVTQNSLDTVADRDYCIEITSALALLMMHLSRFCEEVILWATDEFNYIHLSDSWSTGSSLMPQKKNPDFAELIRGKTGRVYGNLVALLTMMKALPLSYNRDMQEDKESLFSAIDTANTCLTIFTQMIQSASWNTEKMEKACTRGYLNATDLADYLVKKSVPFRTAHGLSAQAVRLCIEKKIPLEKLSLNDFQSISSCIEADVYSILEPRACLEARNITGGPAPTRVKEYIASLKKFCKTKV